MIANNGANVCYQCKIYTKQLTAVQNAHILLTTFGAWLARRSTAGMAG